MADHKLLGEILVEQGIVTRKQIVAAMLESRRLGYPLGQILLEKGYITERQLEEALLVQQEEDDGILPGYSLTLYATEESRRAQLVQALRTLRPRQLPGLLDNVELYSQEHDDLVAVFWEWESPRACQQFLHSELCLEYDARIARLLVAPPERHAFRSIGDYRTLARATGFYFMVVSRVHPQALAEANQRIERLESALSPLPSLVAIRSGTALDDSFLAVDLLEWTSAAELQQRHALEGERAVELAPYPWRQHPPNTFIAHGPASP